MVTWQCMCQRNQLLYYKPSNPLLVKGFDGFLLNLVFLVSGSKFPNRGEMYQCVYSESF